MTFDAIAYGPEEHLLVTFDGRALLAHDAQTEAPKWSLELPAPVVAVLFADLDTFPANASPFGASPWRASASGRWVVAIDNTGAVHVVDAGAGQLSSTLGPFGAPTAVASGPGGRFALATTDRIHLWRGAERVEIPDRAAALAFSNDGASLAIGGADGTLRFLGANPGQAPVETFCAVVHGGINDLAQHPAGPWVVAGRSGMFTVAAAGPQRLLNMPATATRVRFEPRGGHLAAQLSERSVAVYTWPKLEVATRIEYIERPVRGLAFGPPNWLGVGLDHGDGNKIDFLTTATHRTDTHPGRTHRSWMLSVRGKEQTLSAREAEDVRRMRDPFHVPAPPKGGGAGQRMGIGAGVGAVLLGLRLVLALGRAGSSHSYTPPAYNPSFAGLGTTSTKCDVSCAKARVGVLEVLCESTDTSCAAHAKAAAAALDAYDCKAATSELAHVRRPSDSSLASSAYDRAKSGLEEACPVKVSSSHAMLIKLEGPDMTVTGDDLPTRTSTIGETAGQLWAAPSGTLFATTLDTARTRSIVYERDVDLGSWKQIASRRSSRVVQLVAKNDAFVPFIDVDSAALYNGRNTQEIVPPSKALFGLALSGDDMLVVGQGPAAPAPKKTPAAAKKADDDDDDDDTTTAPTPPNVVYRRKLTAAGALPGVVSDWKVEPTLPNVELETLYSGPASVWAVGSAKADERMSTRLYQRTGARWVERRWWGTAAVPPADAMINAVWVTPTNDVFVATDLGIYRSSNGGTTFAQTADPQSLIKVTKGIWGRSGTDVFATQANGIFHFDGKTWAPTPYKHDAGAITGTNTDVYALATSD